MKLSKAFGCTATGFTLVLSNDSNPREVLLEICALFGFLLEKACGRKDIVVKVLSREISSALST